MARNTAPATFAALSLAILALGLSSAAQASTGLCNTAARADLKVPAEALSVRVVDHVADTEQAVSPPAADSIEELLAAEEVEPASEPEAREDVVAEAPVKRDVAARLPGVSMDHSERIRRQMYRTDI